jgi:hypothetical protein
VVPPQIEVYIDAGPASEAFDTLRIPACIGGGTSPTGFWENQFFLSHLKDRGTHGLKISGWTGVAGPSPSGGLLGIVITPESCLNQCVGATRFTLHMRRRTVT